MACYSDTFILLPKMAPIRTPIENQDIRTLNLLRNLFPTSALVGGNMSSRQ
jgi:hypothetical protein